MILITYYWQNYFVFMDKNKKKQEVIMKRSMDLKGFKNVTSIKRRLYYGI